MGRIFYLIGMSSTGKDTMYKLIMKKADLALKPIIPYTTRPIRDGEAEGVQYHFTDEEGYKRLKDSDSIIEDRVYHTVHGDWRYFTVDDGDINLESNSYLAIGTLESYESFKRYFDNELLVPIYIYVDDGVRLSRALKRELKPENQKFKEMCRRFLADCEDFSDDKLMASGIKEENRFENADKSECADNIYRFISSKLQNKLN